MKSVFAVAMWALLINCTHYEPPSPVDGAPDSLSTIDAQPHDTSPGTLCHQCLFDMHCVERCNALGICPTPSTSCQ